MPLVKLIRQGQLQVIFCVIAVISAAQVVRCEATAAWWRGTILDWRRRQTAPQQQGAKRSISAMSLQGGGGNHDSVKQEYMKTILGQETPYEIPAPTDGSRNEEDNDIFLQLLRADSLWNVGKGSEAANLVASLRNHKDWDDAKHGAFARGLEALAGDSSNLLQAYSTFSDAAAAADYEGNDDDSLEAIFFAERAVNIAFWMACTGKMVAAARRAHLSSKVKTRPFAGGILAFATHSVGDAVGAEKIARSAIQAGFDDPWTVHAVAHALYSLGRSQECVAWLQQHRGRIQDPSNKCSAFMKGHMEFHLSLCLLDLEDATGLVELVSSGPLWGTMAREDRNDYWNASGLLNCLWKAELRGVQVANAERYAKEALASLESCGAEPSRSSVFSLCIMRWSYVSATKGGFWERWREELLSTSGNKVLVAVAKAVQAIYASGMEPVEGSTVWSEALALIMPIAEELEELGASPEQREVIEEFVGVVGKRGGVGMDLAAWDKRNRRPNVAFYDTIVSRTDG